MALVLLRLRRVAALAAVALLAWALLSMGGGVVISVIYGAPALLALGLEIAALTASPGPRGALHILTWKHGVLVVIAVLAVSFPIAYVSRVIVMAVIGAAVALSSSLGGSYSCGWPSRRIPW